MAGKRIYELTEKSTLEGSDYLAIDGSGLTEARKVAASKLLSFANVADSSDEYSSSKAYKVGDLVIHDNKLYKCTTACAAAPWSTNQGYFTQTTLASFGTDLKSSLAKQTAVGINPIGAVVNITTFPYVIPTDGYLQVLVDTKAANGYVLYYLRNGDSSQRMQCVIPIDHNYNTNQSFFVKKGLVLSDINDGQNAGHFNFYPLVMEE